MLNDASVPSGAVVFDGANDYGDLPNGLINSLTDITLETWLTENNGGTWSRIFDCGNSAGGENNPTTGTEYIFCTPNSGFGTLRVGLTIGAGEQLTDWAGTRLPAGTQKHVVYTLDSATSTARLYVDGVEVGVNTGVTLNPSSLGTGANNWI